MSLAPIGSLTIPRMPVVIPLRTNTVCARCDQRAVSVCAAIPDEDLHHLAAAATTMLVPMGHAFIAEGDSANSFYNITHGTARLFKLLPDGRRQITGFAGPGTFLGLAAQETYAFGAEALEPVRLCRFSRTGLADLMEDFPALEQRLLQVACTELVMAQEKMLLLGRKTARERLATFLIGRVTQGAHCPHGQTLATTLPLPMSRSDIADYLGLTIETVSRTLSKLKAEGLIALPNASEVVLRDAAALHAIASGEG